MAERVTTEVAELKVLSPSLLLIRFIPGVGVEADHAEEVVAQAAELFGDRSHGNLVDMRKLMYISQEARDAFAASNRQSVSGVAMIVDSPLQRTMANLYLKLSRPSIPTQLFNSESSARAWLEERHRRISGPTPSSASAAS